MAEDAFESEFNAAVNEWRKRHHLPEDDAVLLLIDLFRIHQKHWDELRRRQPPGSENLGAAIDQVAALIALFQKQATDLLQQLSALSKQRAPKGVGRGVAGLALGLAAAGGFILGRWWP